MKVFLRNLEHSHDDSQTFGHPKGELPIAKMPLPKIDNNNFTKNCRGDHSGMRVRKMDLIDRPC